MIRTLLKDSAIYSIPAFLSRGLSLILLPLYTLVLSPADYGTLELLIVFATIVNLTIPLEISQGIARFYTSEQNPKIKVLYASSGFWFTLASYAVFLVVSLIFSDELADLIMGQPGQRIVFELGCFYIFINGIFYVIQNQFRWELRSFQYAVVSLTMTFFTAAVSVWLSYFMKWGLVGLLSGMLAGSLVGAVLGLWWLRSSFQSHFSSKHLYEMLQYSAPLVFSGIAIWVSLYVDRMMINHFLSVDDVGIYGVGYRLASIAALTMVGFQGALTPLIYTHYQNPDTPNQLSKIFRIYVFFALLIFLFLTLFVSDILVIMTTPAFYGASDLMFFLVPAILLASMYIFSPGISIVKKTHLILWINIFGCMLNIGLNYLLIPIFGIKGAGMATMLSYAAIFTAYTFIGQRYYPIPHNWMRILAAVGFVIFVTVLLPQLTLPDMVRWVINMLVLLGFMLVAVGLGLIKRDEISSVWLLVSQRIIVKT